MLDEIFGRPCFQNEIIWAYDYGARSKTRWPAKHDNLLWYTRDPKRYTFNLAECDRIPYMAPRLVGATKAARGKLPTDVWWHTIVSPTGKEKTGYATQKPLGILERIIRVHSNPGDRVLDFFAGSGTTGAAAATHGRQFLLVDESPEAIAVMAKRLQPYNPAIEKPLTPKPRPRRRKPGPNPAEPSPTSPHPRLNRPPTGPWLPSRQDLLPPTKESCHPERSEEPPAFRLGLCLASSHTSEETLSIRDACHARRAARLGLILTTVR